MLLRRSGNLEFKTVKGVLAPSERGLGSHILIDDYRKTYVLDGGRKAARLESLIGLRVEIKGLVETRPRERPIVHVVQYRPIESYRALL